MKIITTALLLLALLVGVVLWVAQPETVHLPASKTAPSEANPSKPKKTTAPIQYIEESKPLHVNNETVEDSKEPMEMPAQPMDANTSNHTAQIETDNYKVTFQIPKIESNEPSRTIKIDGNVESESFGHTIPLQIPYEGNITVKIQSIYQNEESEFQINIPSLESEEEWQISIDMQNNSLNTNPTPPAEPNKENNQKDTILPQLGQNED